MMRRYLIRQCTNNTCEFRFPAPEESGIGIHCPKCKTPTIIIREIKLCPDQNGPLYNAPLVSNLEITLDNIRSTFNVGAILRSIDGAGIAKAHFCGITPSPENNKVRKTALGSEKSVPFENHKNTLKFITECKSRGKRIWALEKTNKSVNIKDFQIKKSDIDTILIVGNEIIGIDPDVLSICDQQMHIPMVGIKGSLNVAIALGIAIYNLIDFSTY